MSNRVFRQLFDRESCTYTYVLGDLDTKQAIIIDPVDKLVERDTKVLEELGLDLKFAVNTHVHADHITGSGLLKKQWKNCNSVLGKTGNEKALADLKLKENEDLSAGAVKIKLLSTPGHTNGCHTILYDDGERKMAFTGDTVLVRGCGRTDFQQGSSDNLYNSVHKKIFTLPEDTVIYPAHDYKGHTKSTVREEKLHNPRLSKNLDEFKDIMANLNLAYPKMIDVAVPANMKCGFQD